MNIEKSFIISAPKQHVWDFITCPEKVSPSILDCQKIEIMSEGIYQAKMSIKVVPISTSFILNKEFVINFCKNLELESVCT
ncbi:MAG: hypothetical protein HN764_13820 [Gammaproteobacteria bacterium]|jgi:carbon monoxide dehydrogenase subunit G|nr:hypothetical protein [Gammaproteobacteria bacterium]